MTEIKNGRNNMVSRCFLLPDRETVLKQYINDPKLRPQGQNTAHWRREVIALNRLKGKPNVPQMIAYNEDHRWIKMSYCGVEVTKESLPEDWVQQCGKIGQMLTKMKLFHNDVFCKNILVKDGDLYLIDFGMWSSVRYKNNSMVEAIRREVLC